MSLVLSGIGESSRLDALLGLFALLALRHDGRAEACAKVVRKFVELGVAINFDGLLGSIADYIAVVAPSQMIFELGLGPIVERPVQIIG
jgi:hypothetical protein